MSVEEARVVDVHHVAGENYPQPVGGDTGKAKRAAVPSRGSFQRGESESLICAGTARDQLLIQGWTRMWDDAYEHRQFRPSEALRPAGEQVCEQAVEEAAERALLLELTAEQIARHTEQTVESIMHAARARAVDDGRPVDDVLRDWFAALGS